MVKYAKNAVSLGWKYFRKGDLETAKRRFEMAIRHDSTNAPAYFGIAYLHSHKGRLEEAIKYYKISRQYDPTHVHTHANLGYGLLQQGEEKAALESLKKALELDPNCGVAHLSFANYYANKKKWSEASKSAQRAIGCGQTLHPEFRKILEANGATLPEIDQKKLLPTEEP